MIKAKKVYRAIQKKFKDNNEILHNEYETTDAINETIRYLNNAMALQNTDFIEKIVAIRQADHEEDLALDGIDLPEDYITMVSIITASDGYHMSPIPAVELVVTPRQYKVVGNKLYVGTDCNMLYKRTIQEVEDVETGEIDLPVTFFDLLVKVASMILAESPDSDVLLQTVNETVVQIVPRRRYSNAHIRMPWKV